MSTARGFTNQRIAIVLMFRMWGNLEASIRANHAACSILARIMQLLILNSRFGPACLGQGKRRAARRFLPFSLLHIAASIHELRTKSRLLLTRRHVPCNPIICIACSLPGNRRARRSIPAYSSSISGGLDIPSPIGFILACRCVPANWSVPSGRSYIIRVIRRKQFVRWRSPDNLYYVIALGLLAASFIGLFPDGCL